MVPAESKSLEEENWDSERRTQVAKYLAAAGINHGRIGDEPAWCLFPHISLWAIESAKAPGWVGWWAICGDCPTDYVMCTGDRTPRAAIEDIATRWRSVSDVLAKGLQHPDFIVGDPANAQQLASILAARATFLFEAAADDANWD